MVVYRILILEDDLETVERIINILREIEEENSVQIALTVLPDYIQTEEFINKNPQIKFDFLLLDRDCFLGGSFHNVDLNNFDLDKVISISSVPENNKKAMDAGVNKILLKEYSNLQSFARKLKELIKTML